MPTIAVETFFLLASDRFEMNVMRQIPRHWVNTFAILLVSLLVAALLRHVLDPYLRGTAQFTLFFIVVAATAWYGGLLPGLVATVTAAAVGAYFFINSYVVVTGGEEMMLAERLSVFILVGSFISVLGGARLKALRKTEQTVERLRWMGKELTMAEDRQRRAIAQALHDHLQQLLVASRLKLGRLVRPDQPEAARKVAGEVDQLLNEAISYTRSLTVELSPNVLYTDGLAAALESLAAQVKHRYSLDVAVEADPDAEPADETMRVMLFQAVRELLFNVAKHAGTDEATVRLTRRLGRIEVTVTDDGVGVAADAKPGLGLMSIEERLRTMGGCMRMEGAKPGGRGTSVTLVGPVEADRSAAAEPAPAEARPAGQTPATPSTRAHPSP